MEYAALGWLYAMLIGLIPFCVFRSRFSYDLERLLDYLRVIATTDEIVALLEEKKVTNEATLKAFAMSILTLARKYGCEEYAKPLWIWDQPAEHS